MIQLRPGHKDDVVWMPSPGTLAAMPPILGFPLGSLPQRWGLLHGFIEVKSLYSASRGQRQEPSDGRWGLDSLLSRNSPRERCSWKPGSPHEKISTTARYGIMG